MAENKKSFIIYTSWKRWLDGLSLEQKGMWLDWMLSYTNDENPQFPKDQAVMISCMMAQDTLKRDLKKYEAKVERIKSARNQNPNNNKELLENNNQTEISTKSVRYQTEISSVNVNDNVNVNVNDNVISKDIDNKKEIYKENPGETSPLDVPLKPVKHKHGSYGWIQLTDLQYNKLVEEFTKDKLDNYINALDEYVQSTGNKNKYKDWNLVLRKAIRENWFKLEANSQEVKVGNKNVKVKNYQHASDEIVWNKL